MNPACDQNSIIIYTKMLPKLLNQQLLTTFQACNTTGKHPPMSLYYPTPFLVLKSFLSREPYRL